MVCPKCKNSGFVPTPDIPKPIVNIGGKERYSTVDIRRYVCLQCGHRYKTEEKYSADIRVATLFDTEAPSAN